MAIDTADRRGSLIESGLNLVAVLPIPDGTISVADRLQWLGLYPGIAAGSPVSLAYVLARLSRAAALVELAGSARGVTSPAGSVSGPSIGGTARRVEDP